MALPNHDRKASCIPETASALPEIPDQEKNTLRAIMAAKVGVIRDHKGLSEAVANLAATASRSDMALSAFMIAFCALQRKESRGAHFRIDFPHPELVAQRSQFRLADLAEGAYRDLFLALVRNVSEDFPCR